MNKAKRFFFRIFSILILCLSFSNISISQCAGSIYDSGGVGGNYSNNENIVETYVAPVGSVMELTIETLDLVDTDDYLYIYDGASTTSPLMYSLTGNSIPQVITSTGRFITLNLVTNSSGIASGYEITLDCYETESCSNYVSSGLVARYEFKEGSGSLVHDVSGFGTPLNLSIETLSNTTWDSNSGIDINTATRIKSTGGANKINDAIMSNNAFTIESWVQPQNLTQDGPARIVSLSSSSVLRNTTFGQEENEIVSRIRTSDGSTSNNGLPQQLGGLLSTTEANHLVYTFDASTSTEILYLDGVVVNSGTKLGDLSNWDPNYDLILVNEDNDDRDWLGKMYSVSIYDRALTSTEVSQNYDVGVYCGDNSFADYECGQGVEIELFYTGLYNDVPKTLNFNNIDNIDSVLVEVVYKSSNPGIISIVDDNGISYSASPVPIGAFAFIYTFHLPSTSYVTYTNTSNQSNAQSMAAYVYRGGQPGKLYSSKFVSIGSYPNQTHVINIPLPDRTGDQDVSVALPITEITYDNRTLNFSATAGPVSTSFTKVWGPAGEGFDDGCCIDSVLITLNDVPESANNLNIVIESPSSGGQSFVLAGFLHTEIQCFPSEICDDGIDNDNDGYVDCEDIDCGFILNREFDDGLSNWSFSNNSSNSGSVSIDPSWILSGPNSAYVDITSTSGTNWHTQLYQGNLTVEDGKKYEVLFDARASSNRSIDVGLQLDKSPWTGVVLQDFDITTSADSYSFIFTSDEDFINETNLIFHLGETSDNVWIDNLQFKEVCLVCEADAGPDQSQCRNAAFDVLANEALGAVGTWSVISGSATPLNGWNDHDNTFTVPTGTTVLRWTVSDGDGCNVFDEITLSNTTSCASGCIDPLNENGDIEDEGNATNFDLSFNGIPALLIDGDNNPAGWAQRYGSSTPDPANFNGAYYLQSANSNSGNHMIYLKGSSFCLSPLVIQSNVACGKTYKFAISLAAYTYNGSQADAPLALEASVSSLDGSPDSYFTNREIMTPASSSISSLNWNRYEFEVTIPEEGYDLLDFFLTSNSDLHGVMIDDVCVTEVFSGADAIAGADMLNCENSFSLDANTPSTGYTGSWSVVDGAIDFASNSPNTTATLTSGSVATARWTVTDGSCSYYDDVVLAYELIADITSTDEETCAGAAVDISVAGCTGDILWSTGETTSTISVSPVTTTSYTVSCTDAQSANLLQNGDFESATNFDNWNNWSNTSITTDPSHVRTGSKAAFADASTSWAGAAQYVSAVPGERFSLSYYGKTTNANTSANVVLTFFTSAGVQVGERNSSRIINNDYNLYEITSVAPLNATQLEISLSMSNVAQVYIDDMVLTKGNSCVRTSTSTVTIVSSEPLGISNDGPIDCNNSNVVISLDNGSKPVPNSYSFLWESGQTGQTETVSSSGTYMVTVSDDKGCTSVISTVVFEDFSTPNASASVSGVITCDDISSTVSASPSGMSYLWSNNETTQSITVTTGGYYTVTVTDDNGCSDSDNVYVIQDNTPPTVLLDDLSLCEGETGELVPTICEHYPDIEAFRPLPSAGWNNIYGNDRSGLVGDGELCFTLDSLNLDSPQMIGLNSDPNTNNSYTSIDYALYVYIREKTNYFLIQIRENGTSKGTGYSSNTSFQGSQFCIRRTGTTIEYLMDGNIMYTSLIDSNDDLFYDHSIHSGGGVWTNGYTKFTDISLCGELELDYNWSTGETSQSINVSTAGVYTLDVVDAKGCSASAQGNVTVSDLSLEDIQANICVDDCSIIHISATGGQAPFTYYDSNNDIISNGDLQICPTNDSIYSISVIDGSGCVSEAVIDVSIFDNQVVISNISNASICAGETSTLTATTPINSGVDYQWQNSSNGGVVWDNISGATSSTYTTSPLFAKTYFRVITASANGACVDDTSDIVAVNVELESQITTVSEDQEICLGETVTLTVNGGDNNGGLIDYTQWNEGSGSIGDFYRNGVDNENHRILSTDPWGNETVIWEARPEVASGADGGWNSSSFAIDHTQTYRVSVWVNRKNRGINGKFYLGTRGYGTVSGVRNLANNAKTTNPYFYVSNHSASDMAGEDEWVLVVGHIYPSSYTGTTLSPESGRYTLADGRVGGVQKEFKWLPETTTAIHRSYLFYSTDTEVRQQWVYPRFDVIDGTEPSIDDLLAGFDVNEGLGETANWEWYTGSCGGTNVGTGSSISVSPSTQTEYFVRAEGECNNTECLSVLVDVNTPPTASVDNSGPISCDNNNATLTALPAGQNYSWSTGEVTQQITVNAIGSYLVTVTDNNGCSNIASSTVTSSDPTTVQITGPDNICIGESTTVSPGLGGDWTSSDESVAIISNNGNVIGVSGGIAVFSFEDTSSGCISMTDTITISPEMNLNINFIGGPCLDEDSKLGVDIIGGTPGYTYSWTGPSSFVSTDSIIDITVSGNYYVTITDAFGCEESVSGYVYEEYTPYIFTLNTEICEGETVDLSVNSGSAVSYLWSANAGGNTTSSVTVTPSPPYTDYSVTITNDLGCEAEANVTIDVVAKPIVAVTGDTTLCVGTTTTLSPTTGGTWASTNTAIATVSEEGIVTTNTAGSVSFIFTDNDSNCSSDPTLPITVIDKPNPIFTGAMIICEGDSTTLSPTSGGVWSSSNTDVATIENNGNVKSVGPGTTTFIFENNTTGCISDASAELTVYEVNPVSITGDTTLCVGDNTYLTPTSGGTWSSSNNSVASINNLGVVTAIAEGTAYFTFESDFNCTSPQSQSITVSEIVNMTITGTSTLCEDDSAQLTANLPNGIWSSSNESIITIDNITGIYTAIAEGNAIITYSQDDNHCTNDATYNINVIAAPNADLVGSTSLCIGDISNVATSSTGGTWYSTNDLVAVVSNDGVVIGVNEGEAAFIYEASNGCTSDTTAYVTVHPELSVDILFNGGLCLEDDTQLTAQVTGGSPGFSYSWNGPGGFTATSQTIDVPLSGNYTVNVTDTVGCTAQYSAFVYESYEPFIFTLNTEICEGENVTLSINGAEGGSYLWGANADNSTDQSITVVPPVPSATYAVTVTNDIGCTTEAIATIDVNPTPSINLIGGTNICVGKTTSFSSGTEGIWTSSNNSVASINSAGVVTGLNAGTVVFTFREDGTGCYSEESEVITVANNAPVAILGDNDVCIGSPEILSASEPGGVWSSSNNSIATIDSVSGEITGLSSGVVTILYSIDPGAECLESGEKEITIRDLPSVNINGPSVICEGDITYLVPTSGGTWTSSNQSVATVSSNGVVTGVSGGAANFTFTSSYGCVKLLGTAIQVIADPIVSNPGPAELCINETVQLTSNVSGLWVSSNNLIASVSSSGLVLAKKAGTVDFSFIEFSNGCQASNVISIIVNGVPVINGLSASNICIGETANITPSTGGVWSSNDTTIATISDNGLITGVAAGATTFMYTDLSTGCISDPSSSITIEELPEIIEPDDRSLCVGDMASVLPANGGVWSTSDVSVATIDNQGNITAISSGTVVFKFTNSSTGCVSENSQEFTISNPSIASISGDAGLCIGEVSTLIGSHSGNWSSNNTAIGSIDDTGQFTAIAPGIVTITLTTTDDCVQNPTFDVQVNPSPIASFIGSSTVCIGSTTTLSPQSGGVWHSDNTTVATVTNSGLVSSHNAGTATFTFTDTVSMCSSVTSTALNVFGKPDILIAGDTDICIGGETSMSPSSGGIWVSTNNSVASISTSGLINGISAGDVRFIFTEAGTGCVSDTSTVVSILPKPIVFVSGDSQICQNETTTLSPSTGGSWVSDNESVATVTNGGIVTAHGQGIARFTFISNAGCASNKTNPIIVFGTPSIFMADNDLCIDETIQLSPSSGGSWSSLDESIATITDDGFVTGVSAGDVSFVFTDSSNGCSSAESDVVTVNPIPEIDVVGSNEICIGGTTNLVPSTGGWWQSLDPAIAGVSNNGTITGITEGTARFLFTQTSTGCSSDTSRYIDVISPVSPEFVGGVEICIGDTTFITPNSGGTWLSSNESVASISNEGMIIGVGQGITSFQFIENGTNCSSEFSETFTVNGAPTILIDGTNVICIGSATQLLSSTEGTWESTQTSVATINTEGLVTGVAEGIAQVIFTSNDTGCSSEKLSITVQAETQLALTGDEIVCIGYNTTLSPKTGGFWISNNPDVATITNSGVVTGIAPGKASFRFTDSFTGCETETENDIVTVSNCTNHDFNVATENLLITGDLSTNDNMPLGTTYSSSFLLIEKPTGSASLLVINNDGTYEFSANRPGNYRYNVPVCTDGQSAGCPTRMLEITVVTNIYSEGNPVANIDIMSTYANIDSSLMGTPIMMNAMANDKCVYTAGCDMDYSSINVTTMPNHGVVSTDVLGNVEYTPEAGFIGFDTIYYEVCADGYSNCNESMQVVLVKKINALNSVVASDDFEYTVVGNEIIGNVLENDSDPEGDAISVTPQGSLIVPIITSDGSYYIDALGDFYFTPNSSFNGSTEIVYTVCDDNLETACTDATIHILVFDDISLKIRVYLEGSLMTNGNAKTAENKPLMRDDLRNSPFTGENYIPLVDPYSTAFSIFSNLPSKYSHLGPHMIYDNTTISDSLSVFSVTGDDAIVDWIHVELRSKADYHHAFATRSGLIQRDGDIVDLDGVSPLRFQGVNVDSFYVVVNHRSHLAVMTQKVHYGTYIDLTDNDFPLFDFGTTKGGGFDYTGLAMKEDFQAGYRACWAGDFDVNGKVKFAAPFDDQTYMYQDVLFSSPSFLINYDFAIGYYTGDFDMNSKAKYDNPNDDKNYLFAQLLFYPLNFNFVSNFDLFIEQVPESSN